MHICSNTLSKTLRMSSFRTALSGVDIDTFTVTKEYLHGSVSVRYGYKLVDNYPLFIWCSNSVLPAKESLIFSDHLESIASFFVLIGLIGPLPIPIHFSSLMPLNFCMPLKLRLVCLVINKSYVSNYSQYNICHQIIIFNAMLIHYYFRQITHLRNIEITGANSNALWSERVDWTSNSLRRSTAEIPITSVSGLARSESNQRNEDSFSHTLLIALFFYLIFNLHRVRK